MSIELCSLFTQIDRKTLSRYFHESFKEVKKEWLKIHNKSFDIAKLSSEWYFNTENLWEFINIDEKNLCWELYTIISNPKLWWKWLIWIIPWVKAVDIKKFIFLHSTEKQRAIVKEIALDMANTMQNIAKWLFPTCLQVVDRFHVMKNILEDMWALISKNKTIIKKEHLEEQDRAKVERRPVKHQKFANTETKLELISRWRYQLLKRRKDWNLNQYLRWDCMKLVPWFEEITAMYEQIEKIFEIYDSDITVDKAKEEFTKWFVSISRLDFITELQNAWRMIKNHFDRICNYFSSRLTNGYAEWLNSRMQKIISNSKWFKDQDYMIYRMIKIFG